MNICSQFTDRLSLANTTMSICLVAVLGCDVSNNAPRPAQQEHMISREIPVVSRAELHELVQQKDELVLVEFGVNFGCVRCDDMRPQIARLADEFENRAKVVRVDFDANRQLAAQFGADICPSYVLFRDGELVVTRSHPISADLIAADLDAAVRRQDHSTPTVSESGDATVE